MLVTFEGVEGSGKTTQIELLCQYLVEAGYDVVRTREPGGTPFGEALRKVSLQHGFQVFPLSELLVFMAIRAQHVEAVIGPALQAGKIVICDRFVDATYAYQGYGRGIDLGIIETLNRLVTKGIRPNLTVVLNCPATTGLRRKMTQAGEKDRFEGEERAFHRRIQQAYLKLAKEDKRFFVVDGRKDIIEIHDILKNKVETLIKSHGI
jgi:dTMP kinase